MQGRSCRAAGPPACPHLSVFAEVPSPSWDSCSFHVAPLSWLRSPPQLHLFILPEGLCSSDRSSLSCSLNIRSPCPALLRHLRSPSRQSPLEPLWVLDTSLRARAAKVGPQSGSRASPENCLSICKPTTVTLESTREMERERPSLCDCPGPHASVSRAFRARISPLEWE